MQVFIFRSERKEGLYVYLKEKENLQSLPAPVLKQLGNATFTMEIELTADSKLGQEDAATVLGSLESQGFHLQMPRNIELELDLIARRDDEAKGQAN